MSGTPIAELPAAGEHLAAIRARLAGREPVVFLDYDGTLTPIVDDPAEARLSPAARRAVRRLAAACTVAVVSGRDLDDVRAMVGIDSLHYAGSHGFDIAIADGRRIQRGEEFLPALDAAEAELQGLPDEVAGVAVERKRFAVAVHFRGVAEADVTAVEQAVRRVAARHDDLRVTGGKRIFELRPDLDWDKGRALQFLLASLGLDGGGAVPVYVGDDVTDEDAFAAVADDGLGLVVRGEDDERPTAADYAFADTGEVAAFLDELAARLEEASPAG